MKPIHVFKWRGKWVVRVRRSAIVHGFRSWGEAMAAADYLIRSWAPLRNSLPETRDNLEVSTLKCGNELKPVMA